MAHRFRKVFPNSQKPMSMRLPIQLPITCTANGESVVLGFFDTARISAVNTKNHVSQILNNLCSIPVLLANFRKIDPRFFVPRLLALANDAKLVVMYDIEHQNQEQDTANVTVRVLKSHWDDRLEAVVYGELQRMFDDSAVFICSTCGHAFARVDGSVCKQPGAHVAERARQQRDSPSVAFATTTTLA
jgi:hypothetical protein